VTFELDSNWNLKHVPSGLCATAASSSEGAAVALAACDPANKLQKFVNDYTRVRNTVDPFTLQGTSAKLAGQTGTGEVTIGGGAGARCKDPAAYNTTDPVFSGSRCMGLQARKAGDASAAGCAKAACAGGDATFQWKSAEEPGGGCWAGEVAARDCQPDKSWVGGHIEGADKSKTWSSWVFFPNTGQLRNQYTANVMLGYPMCLSTCPA
jgi:hypothetical protein